MNKPFLAPIWIKNAHFQTIWPALRFRRNRTAFHWKTLTGADAGIIDLAMTDTLKENTPTIVLFHGLEGSVTSHYCQALMKFAKDQKFQVIIPHFRGCGPTPVHRPRAYHAGDSEEIFWVLNMLKKDFSSLYAVGVSLGGNALIKAASEHELPIKAMCAVSVPFDLKKSSEVLDNSPHKWLYTQHFLNTMKKKAAELALRFPAHLDWQSISRSTTLKEFDNEFTAPLHGFKDVEDYWEKSSSIHHLKNIVKPCLIIQALDDPFVPVSSWKSTAMNCSHIEWITPKNGGHVGFVQGTFPGHIDWLPKTIIEFFIKYWCLENHLSQETSE